MMPTAKAKARPANLRDACVDEARAIIAESGVESLSLRDVARRLGVSHQAPYKHFPSRDHILAEVVRRAYADFAAHLDARPRHDDPHADLSSLGHAYLDYARTHPLEYRLMFGTPLPPPPEHPDMLRDARHAFSILETALSRLPVREPHHDALFVWSTMHGLASIMNGHAIETLGWTEEARAAAMERAMEMVEVALRGG